MRRRLVLIVVPFALAAAVGMAYLAVGRSSGGGSDSQNSNSAAEPSANPGAAVVGHGPPVPQFNQLPEDKTGDTTWVETSLGGSVMRHPSDDKEWAVRFDPGDYFAGFDGVPYMRVTHLTTGKTRIYSLLTGELMLCTDRSAVLAAPSSDLVVDQGEPEDCNPQDLAPGEQAVFAHIKITGRYMYYHGPSNHPMRTVPGWKETPVPSEWKWSPPGYTPEPSTPLPEATPAEVITPTLQPEPGGAR